MLSSHLLAKQFRKQCLVYRTCALAELDGSFRQRRGIRGRRQLCLLGHDCQRIGQSERCVLQLIDLETTDRLASSRVQEYFSSSLSPTLSMTDVKDDIDLSTLNQLEAEYLDIIDSFGEYWLK